MNRLLLAIPATMLLMAACTGSEKSQYGSISAGGWLYGDTVSLQPQLYDPDTSTVVRGPMSIVVRHSNSYEYSNLWLRVDYRDQDTTVTDTVNIVLADDYGNWLGSGIGVSYQHSQRVAEEVTVDLTSPVRVTHIMRSDTLHGIEQVGVVIGAQ